MEDNPVTMHGALRHLAVSLGSWVVTIGTTYVMVRLVSSPDFGKTLVMRTARAGERLAMAQATGWANVADKCHAVYDSMRPVGV